MPAAQAPERAVRGGASLYFCFSTRHALPTLLCSRRYARLSVFTLSVMDHNSFKTASAKLNDVERQWHVVDAENQVVGRLAARVAAILRGKHKPSYTPHIDTGDFVVVVNAEKARFTGRKETDKEYFSHSGYPGGVTTATPREMRAKKPTFLIENAVKGMLPHNRLGRQMLKKLKVYAGPEHPHEAQEPQPLEL